MTAAAGLVLFGHGARDPRWADSMEALASAVRARAPGLEVRCAYLEFMTPDLAGAVDALRACGTTSVVVAPVFLAAGGHVLRDLPQRVAEIEARHPGLALRVEPALGTLPAVIDAMAAHCASALTAATPAPQRPQAGKKGVDSR